MRILLHYGGVWLRYDLWIFGLIVGALGRCRCLLLRTVLTRDVIVGYAANDRPGSPQGCPVASRHSARESGGEGANQKNVPLDQVPLAPQSLFERPAGGVLQVPERLKENLSFMWHRNSSSLPQSVSPRKRGYGTVRCPPSRESRTAGSGAFLVTFAARQK